MNCPTKDITQNDDLGGFERLANSKLFAIISFVVGELI